MLAWLLGAALGPAAVALPVNWAADALTSVTRRWFRVIRRTDDLSRLVKAVTDNTTDLNSVEFAAVRKLLEDQQTWAALGHGTIDELVGRIAGCLPPRDGRTAHDARTAALAIARGLIEFAVADLDPRMFQQVLLARQQRMQAGQADALDEAMLDLHSRFADVMGQLKVVLDRLPPGPAGRGEIAIYLHTLIDWLNTDPWPRDFGGRELTPAAIERKLHVTSAGWSSVKDLDADALAQQCHRLVLLGEPGSGKTWLAKRTARRCAENALQALASGQALNKVELPLYTTCAHLFGAGGGIREAVTSSALDQLADMGSSHINSALRVHFTERSDSTLLIIDSLDEAHGPSERLRQAATLPWRIVLTSRPSAWKNQLNIDYKNQSQQVGELQPLRYPDDVEPFIRHWFAAHPQQGDDLVAQIARRRDLQQAATVPLILAFYCIIGGSRALPEFRSNLYAAVLKRMLTGRWRNDDDRQPHAETCLHILRTWAWSGAASDLFSGLGAWTDDILTERATIGAPETGAIDHVATPIGPPNIDTGNIVRRFIHRSIREHLVAEHIASFSIEDAAEALLPHLWYDPDWEYSAPAAVVMHSQHDALLRQLMCRAARSTDLPKSLSTIDAGQEFRRFLVRIALHSSETDWSLPIREIIGQARVDLAPSVRIDEIAGALSWGESNRQVRKALLSLLTGQTNGPSVRAVTRKLMQLDPGMDEKSQARDVLLRLLVDETDGSEARKLAQLAVQLDATMEQNSQVRDTLRRTFFSGKNSMLADLAIPKVWHHSGVKIETSTPTSHDNSTATGRSSVMVLDMPARDNRQVRDVLLRLLARRVSAWIAQEMAADRTQKSAVVDRTSLVVMGFRQNLIDKFGDYDNVQAARRTVPLDLPLEEVDVWCTWALRPIPELITAIRRNSTITCWLEILPSLVIPTKMC